MNINNIIYKHSDPILIQIERQLRLLLIGVIDLSLLLCIRDVCEDLFDIGNLLLGLQVLLGLSLFLLQRFQHMVPQGLTLYVFNTFIGPFLSESFNHFIIPIHSSNYQRGPLLVILRVRVSPAID